MNTIHKIVILLIVIVYSITVSAQDNLTLYNMKSLSQKTYLNPGKMPETKINISLPVISSTSFGYTNGGFILSDLISKRPQDDSLILTADNMLSKLSDNNLLAASFSTDIFGIGIRVKRNYFSFNARAKTDIGFSYSKDLMTLFLKGNTAFLGTEANIGFKLNSTVYTEYGLGFTHLTKDEKLSYGARVKILSGMANLNTVNSNLTVFTNADDYSTKTTANILINSSLIDTGSISSDGISSNIFGNNKGLGFDLGAEYKINDKFSVSASIIDIGSINWKDNVSNYQSDPKKSNFTFGGFDVKKFFSGSTAQPYLDSLSDSLKNAFYPTKTNNAYKTKLPTKFYAGVNYQITKSLNAGFLLMGKQINDKFYTSFALSVNKDLGKILNVSASYSHVNTTSNLGLGLSLNLLPIQIYMVSDNIFALTKFDETRNTNVHFGINLAIGRVKSKMAKEKEKTKEKVKK